MRSGQRMSTMTATGVWIEATTTPALMKKSTKAAAGVPAAAAEVEAMKTLGLTQTRKLQRTNKN